MTTPNTNDAAPAAPRKLARYAVVRIDNGPRNPHTGIARTFGDLRAAVRFCHDNQPENRSGSLTRAWHPWAILDRETQEKRDWRAIASDLADAGESIESR